MGGTNKDPTCRSCGQVLYSVEGLRRGLCPDCAQKARPAPRAAGPTLGAGLPRHLPPLGPPDYADPLFLLGDLPPLGSRLGPTEKCPRCGRDMTRGSICFRCTAAEADYRKRSKALEAITWVLGIATVGGGLLLATVYHCSVHGKPFNTGLSSDDWNWAWYWKLLIGALGVAFDLAFVRSCQLDQHPGRPTSGGDSGRTTTTYYDPATAALMALWEGLWALLGLVSSVVGCLFLFGLGPVMLVWGVADLCRRFG